MKVGFISLGCAKNQVNCEQMIWKTYEAGYEVALGAEDCDVAVVNTCGFLQEAREEALAEIDALAQAKAQGKLQKILVTGCMAQKDGEDFLKKYPQVDLLIGTAHVNNFSAILQDYLHQNQRKAGMYNDLTVMPREFEGHFVRKSSYAAWVPIMYGCNNFCTYCIIPYARGPVRSLSLEQAVEQTRQLAAEGYREIVLTGIEISSWGHDFKNGQSLIDLLEALSAAAPEVRLRLGSLEPRTVTEDFCRRAAALPNLCPQFHLSMQSGCDATLKRMNRKYDTARYLESVELLNRWFDRPAVTTDLITGFPEETEEEFAQTLDFIRKCRFAQMHIFPYSIRPGTPAAQMEQVSKAVKEERAHRAAAVAEEMHRSYLEGCVGQTYPVLFEQPKNGKFFGHAPNYMEVLVDGAELHNALRTVRITDVDGEALLGEIVEQEAEA